MLLVPSVVSPPAAGKSEYIIRKGNVFGLSIYMRNGLWRASPGEKAPVLALFSVLQLVPLNKQEGVREI